MALTTAEARTFYDRFGARQDRQGFYEDPALDALVGLAEFDEATTVFEFGCGTGRFAERLLSAELPPSAGYIGCDISPVMVKLATERTSRFAARARIRQSDSGCAIPLEDGSADRVVATYVLDLLGEADIARFLEESHRVLSTRGRLCLVGLTDGVGPVSRFVAVVWGLAFRLKPMLVGGCRPISSCGFLEPEKWEIVARRVIVSWGIPSEIVVARPRTPPSAR